MPTRQLPSRTYAAGETVRSQTVTVPQTITQARLTVALSVAQMQDPATDVMVSIEGAPLGTPAGSPLWRLVAMTGWKSDPANTNFSQQPYIDVSPRTMELFGLQGNLVRAVVVNRSASDITFAGTLVAN